MDGTWVATRLAGLAIVLSTFVACGGGGSGGGGGGQGAGEPQGGGGDATLATLVVTPARASNHPLFQTTSTTATFGIPIPQDWGVGEVGGRPALGIAGSSRWQFRTLDQWPDGSVRWALVDIATTVGTGQPAPLYDLVPGDGVATTPDIGRVDGAWLRLDTGPLQVAVDRFAFDLFEEVVADGVRVVAPGSMTGLVGTTSLGGALGVGPSSVTLAENGPARAVIKAEGTLVDALGQGVLDYTCRLTARAGSRDVEVTLTVRNASILRPAHARIGSLELFVDLDAGDDARVSLASPDGELDFDMEPGHCAHVYQAYTDSHTEGVLGPGPGYKPHIPKLDGYNLFEEGWLLSYDGTILVSTDKTDYPEQGYARLAGSRGGMTASIRHMPYMWPAAFEVNGGADAPFVVGLFPRKNFAGYTFSWRQHESRTATLSFFGGAPSEAAAQTARRGDAVVSGRYLDYLDYHRAGVFRFDLVSAQEQQLAYGLLGLDHEPDPQNVSLEITRFLPAHLGGGENNHAFIEKRLADHFLRFGLGGHFLSALDLALYKAEWQIRRSDDFHHASDPGAINPTLPHSTSFEGDLEHRYREGLVLAWHLTGDERFRDALLDEAEILPTLTLTPHERSMYQTLRALVVLYEFVDDPAVKATLLADLRARLTWFVGPTLDVHSATDGWGWEDAPGMGRRGYFVNSTQNVNEQPPGEHFQTRGFITATLGPMAFYMAARALPDGDPLIDICRMRLRDLAHFARDELYPFAEDPVQRAMVYSYAVTLQQVVSFQSGDFHSLLLPMAEAWRDSGDDAYLTKALEQIEGFAAHGNLDDLDTRLENQHFFRLVLEQFAGSDD